jgi:hypothetical protein
MEVAGAPMEETLSLRSVDVIGRRKGTKGCAELQRNSDSYRWPFGIIISRCLIDCRTGESELLPAASQWAKLSGVRGSVRTAEEAVILLIDDRSRRSSLLRRRDCAVQSAWHSFRGEFS